MPRVYAVFVMIFMVSHAFAMQHENCKYIAVPQYKEDAVRLYWTQNPNEIMAALKCDVKGYIVLAPVPSKMDNIQDKIMHMSTIWLV
jgi:hypothetical protein